MSILYFKLMRISINDIILYKLFSYPFSNSIFFKIYGPKNSSPILSHRKKIIIFGGFGLCDPTNPFNGSVEGHGEVRHHVDRNPYDTRVWNNDL